MDDTEATPEPTPLEQLLAEQTAMYDPRLPLPHLVPPDDPTVNPMVHAMVSVAGSLERHQAALGALFVLRATMSEMSCAYPTGEVTLNVLFDSALDAIRQSILHHLNYERGLAADAEADAEVQP